MSDFAGAMFVRGEELIQALPVASGGVIEVGDMLKVSGGNVLVAAATTDDVTLIGIAREAHYATDPAKPISVALFNGGAVYRVPLDAAASINVGDLLQLYTSAPSKKLTKSATDPVAMAVETTVSSAFIHVVFLLPATTGAIRLVRDAS